MNGKKNVAIVGFGGMGRWHTHQIRKREVCDLIGVYDIRPECMEYAKGKGIDTYGSFEEVLSDKRIDIIVIATENDVHKPLAIAAMDRGHNVVTEKPVTVSSADLAEMIEASKRNGVLFTTHQNRRWDGDMLSIKKVIEDGTIGPVFNIESRVHGSRGIPGDWRGKKEHGGGMMLDWGVHLLDQIVNVLLPDRKIESVYATMDHVTNHEVDDGFRMTMRFEGELRVYVEVGTSNFIDLPRWYVQGENGTVSTPWDLSQGRIVCCTNWEAKDAVPIKTAAGITKTMAPRTDDTIKEVPFPIIEGDVHDFYRNLVDVLDGKAVQLITHEHLMKVMKLMETAFESDRTGSVIRLD
ncbi:MAG: Gfo/Idh/MocA family oxidoreductase [Clostridia bacterium]|nr:Gfo/Idh/MocA family oxidoreductase [Clostridia bacterium]